ncbi:MAG: hypothetical protein S0880_25840 [Actinomycetota bacterium]|nr:hypothetical protein [Actinomycetota bacterium]
MTIDTTSYGTLEAARSEITALSERNDHLEAWAAQLLAEVRRLEQEVRRHEEASDRQQAAADRLGEQVDAERSARADAERELSDLRRLRGGVPAEKAIEAFPRHLLVQLAELDGAPDEVVVESLRWSRPGSRELLGAFAVVDGMPLELDRDPAEPLAPECLTVTGRTRSFIAVAAGRIAAGSDSAEDTRRRARVRSYLHDR